MPEQIVKRILTSTVYDVAVESPLDPMPRLSERIGRELLLKREDEQAVFSFKLRGAYNRMSRLSEEERACGVVASSAGNHAQGVALAAQRLRIKATIVMPRTTPKIKIDAVRARKARVVRHGDSYDEAYAHALELAGSKGYTFIHPYDDPDVIAGQGTVGMEILRQCSPRPEAIFVPVGGGGLVAGVAAYVKYIDPAIKVIGVEPDDAPTLHAAMARGRRVTLPQVGLFADGVAVRIIGKHTFKLARELVDEVVLVNSDEICAAIKDIFVDTRSIAEPAGALAVAGAKRYAARAGGAGGPLVAINSGANMNFDRLRYVAERAELGEQREALLAVTIPEQPGSFLEFCNAIGNRPITEFNYRYSDASEAHVFAGIQLESGNAERDEIVSDLKRRDYPVQDMTDDELAKVHIRHMVGGRASGAENELLYRFEFPERPRALLNFLNHMAAGWNISLFHYRNQGGDFGRVLVGVQVPPGERKRFREFLKELAYPYADESENAAYRLFL